MFEDRKIDMNTLLQYMDEVTVDDVYSYVQSLAFLKVVKLEVAMIMVSTKDIYDTSFYIGEVLVTMCEVECAKMRGWGCIHGKSEKKAFISAVADFFENCGDDYKSESEQFVSLIGEKQKKVVEAIELEMKITASTKVDFKTMAGE